MINGSKSDGKVILTKVQAVSTNIRLGNKRQIVSTKKLPTLERNEFAVGTEV